MWVSNVISTCSSLPMIDPDLHVVLPDAVDDHPLEGEGVGEGRDLQQTLEADRLVDLAHLLQHADEGDLLQTRDVLVQVGLVVGVLEVFDAGLDLAAELERVEVDLEGLVERLHFGRDVGDEAETFGVLDQRLTGRRRGQAEQVRQSRLLSSKKIFMNTHCDYQAIIKENFFGN